MKKIKKILIIILAIMVSICLLFLVLIYCVLGYRIIPVKYITSLDCTSVSMEESFYAMFTVQTAREWIQTEDMKKVYYHPEDLVNKLNNLDDNQRIVLADGKRIKYFYYFDQESSPSVHAAYYDEPIENKVYFYTVNYRGSMIDYAHH